MIQTPMIFGFIKWLSRYELEFEETFIINIDKIRGKWANKTQIKFVHAHVAEVPSHCISSEYW